MARRKKAKEPNPNQIDLFGLDALEGLEEERSQTEYEDARDGYVEQHTSGSLREAAGRSDDDPGTEPAGSGGDTAASLHETGSGSLGTRRAEPVQDAVPGRDTPGVADGERGGAGRPGDEPADQRGSAAAAGAGDDGHRHPDGVDDQSQDAGEPAVPAHGQLTPAFVAPEDYRFPVGFLPASAGAAGRYQQNIDALRTLFTLEEDQRNATPDEQATLSRYVGWGGLSQVFDPKFAHANTTDRDGWAQRYHEVQELLLDDEYEAARRSTLDSFYTSESVVRAIYDSLEHMGLNASNVKNVLEPSCGIGNFIGLRPESWKNVNFTAIEQDSITARIAQKLHPTQRVINSGFQDVKIRENHYDLVIGNPPFGSQKLHDSRYPEESKHSIHNYFIMKGLRAVRPGGVMAFVVSRYFMDQVDDGARKQISDSANFLGAVRLPTEAFRENANTEVTTDIVFFQKKGDGVKYDPLYWGNTHTLKLNYDGKDGQEVKKVAVNGFFTVPENKGLVLGDLELRSGQFGPIAFWKDSLPQQSIQDRVARALHHSKAFPKDAFVPKETSKPSSEKFAPASSGGKEQRQAKKPESRTPRSRGEYIKLLPVSALPEDSFAIQDGHLKIVGDIVEGEQLLHDYEAPSDAAFRRISGMIEIRDTLRRLLDAERDPGQAEEAVENLRESLNDVYERFQKRWGYLSVQANRRLMRTDPQWPLVESLERQFDPGVTKAVAEKQGVEPRPASAQRADIFFQRVTRHPDEKPESFDSVKDAYLYALNQFGDVNEQALTQIEALTGRARDEVARELRGIIFLNPTSQEYETASRYLSGNVKRKLQEAQAAAQQDTRFEDNVQALEKVQPADIEAVDIAVQLNSTWVPASDIEQFARETLGSPGQVARYLPEIGRWNCKFACANQYVANTQWGIPEYPAHRLMKSIMENTPIRVWYEDSEGEKILDSEKTAVANRKARELENHFQDWIWKDAERRERLEKLYNDTMNTHIAPRYDGSHLTLPGSNPTIALRPHQKDAVWRGLQSNSTLFDHTVGAGKTIVNIALAKEGKRMGLINKPMIVVPNHLLRQWQDDFFKLYPDAKVLIAEKDQMTKKNRERFVSRIATGEWDSIIISHSAFKRLGMPDEFVERFLKDQVQELVTAIARIKEEEGGRSPSVKELERRKESLTNRLKKMSETGEKDRVLKFTDLGVDALMVDEADEFKNLQIVTKHTRIGGLGNLSGSDRAFDMFLKVRYLNEQEGKTYFSTGTPISNSISEVYTMQRYMDYDGLMEKGLHHFDAWVSTYGQMATGLELDATGVNFKINTRFAKFQNVPELISQYRSFADVITKKDLYEQAERAGSRFPIPRIEGGKPENIVVPRSPEQAMYMGEQDRETGMWTPGSIIDRMENLPPDPRIDNPLNITTDARKCGLDFRLVNPDADDYEDSKVNECVRRAMGIYQRYEDVKGTQLIFCDLSTPKAKRSNQPTQASEKDAAADEGGGEGDQISVSMDDLVAARSRFSVYDDIKRKLIEEGVPENEIRFIHDANTDARKAKLFSEVNAGEVRFLIGSTGKMGAGTNVQERLVALHDLDCPWRPRDLEQRLGRIERQGNKLYEADPDNFRIQVLRYATEQTYDSRMWQTVESKAVAIEQFRRGDLKVRTIDDVHGDAASAAEMKAAATGNHLIFLQVQLNHELKEAEAEYSMWKRNRHNNEAQLRRLEDRPKYHNRRIEEFQTEIQYAEAQHRDDKPYTLNGVTYKQDDERGPVVNHLQTQIARVVNGKATSADCGTYMGYQITCVDAGRFGSSPTVGFQIAGAGEPHEPDNLRYTLKDGQLEFSLSGFLRRIDNYLGSTLPDEVAHHQKALQSEGEELKDLRQKLQEEPEFPGKHNLELLRQDCTEVLNELRKSQKNPDYKSSWQPRSHQQDLYSDSDKPKTKVAASA